MTVCGAKHKGAFRFAFGKSDASLINTVPFPGMILINWGFIISDSLRIFKITDILWGLIKSETKLPTEVFTEDNYVGQFVTLLLLVNMFLYLVLFISFFY